MTKRLLALGLLFAGFLWVSLLSGCGSGCGDIEDEVFIQKALEHFIATQSASIWSVDSVRIPIKIYTSVDEFRSENPDCCSFSYRGYEGDLPDWWTRFSNDYAGVVFINYLSRRIEDGSVVKIARRTVSPMNSCAEPISITKIWPR
ncbi:MAG: hypothetical protein L3J37_11620 [Rhodobacteraceae bacterium]|nr:hypothetical protein [Paracoccaceae bacterium]